MNQKKRSMQQERVLVERKNQINKEVKYEDRIAKIVSKAEIVRNECKRQVRMLDKVQQIKLRWFKMSEELKVNARDVMNNETC